jgi:hypothetical protein
MIHDADVSVFHTQAGEDVLLVKVVAGDAPTRPTAQRVINALRTAIPVSQLALEVVVLNGDQGALFGSSHAVEDLCRRDLAQIRTLHHWSPRRLDW